MSFKVLVTCPPMLNQIGHFHDLFKKKDFKITAPKVIQTLTEDELIKIVPKHHGWIIGDDPATAKVFESGKLGNLRAAVKWGIGTDNVDFDACNKLNIPITNTPGMFGNEVADLAMCYILGLARDAFLIDREVRNGSWIKSSGISLEGKTIGIVGLGDIGKCIAKRANAHNLKIIGWDPFTKKLPKYIQKSESFPTNIDKCDFIVFACSLNNQTKYMFNDSTLKKIKKPIRIVNVSRGHLIKESSILKGLESGKIDSVALDVYEIEPIKKDNKLLLHPRCIFGSHNGSNTVDAVIRASNKAILIISKMLRDKY